MKEAGNSLNCGLLSANYLHKNDEQDCNISMFVNEEVEDYYDDILN